VRRYAYDPYGNDTSPTGSWTTTTPFRYAGGEADATGLYDYGQRYYSPTNGRWTQQDPLNQASDLVQGNRYGYVGGDPMNSIDPTGASIWSETKAVASQAYSDAKAVGRLAVRGVRSPAGKFLLRSTGMPAAHTASRTGGAIAPRARS
jgi:RHS repeat-associated protein